MTYTCPSSKDASQIWGHRFDWTKSHLTAEQLEPYLYSYDLLAANAMDRIDAISPPQSKGWRCPHSSDGEKRDVYALLKEHAATDEVLDELWREVTTVPEWVDWDQIARGQRLVYRYYGQILIGLMFKSLIGGFGAWRVVETLSRTGGFGINVARRRVLETLQHFMDVTKDIDSIKPGGEGFEANVRVRLLHAAVRRRLMELALEKPRYYDTEKLGIPINSLHQMGTIATYSASIVYVALPRQGVFFSEQQAADYLALWRWVGHVLGTPVDWMATPAQAKAMMESIVASEIDPSPASRTLTSNTLTAESRVPPFNVFPEYLGAEVHLLNGHDLAIALGVEKPRLWLRAATWLQSLLLLIMSCAYPLFPNAIRELCDQYFRTNVQKMITSHNGHAPPTYEFQYLPQLDSMTLLAPNAATAAFYTSQKLVVPSALSFVVAIVAIMYLLKGKLEPFSHVIMTESQILQGLRESFVY